MTKKLNEDSVLSELKESSFFPKKKSSPEEKKSQSPTPPKKETKNTKSTSESTDQSTSRLKVKNTKRDDSPILGRPKAFYITEKQDDDIEQMVRKLNKHINGKIKIKVDRSIVIRTILQEQDLESEETLKKLSSRLVDTLVDRLVD